MQRKPALQRLWLGAFLLVWNTPGTLAQEVLSPSQVFEHTHREAQARSQKGDWQGARQMWLELLRSHAGADHARPWLPEIREDLRRASFWFRRRRPDPKPLIAGELLSYSRATGKLRVSYEPSQLADFEQLQGYSLHPMHFSASYSVVLEGTPQSLSEIGLLLALENESGYLLQSGLRVAGSGLQKPHLLERIEGAQRELLESLDPLERNGRARSERVKLKINVARDTLRVSYDGRSIFSIKKHTRALGQVGIIHPSGFERLTLEGVAGASWLEDRVDAALGVEWKAFELSYRDPPEFAAWGAERPLRKTSRKLEDLTQHLPFPERVTPAQEQVILRLRSMMKSGLFEELIGELARLPRATFSAATREFLLATNALAAKRYTHALQHIAALERLAPISRELRTVEALLNTRVERRQRAIALLRKIIAEDASDAAMYAELAQQLLLEGQLEDSRKQIDAGLRIAPADGDLQELRQQVAKASQGPSWRRAQRVMGQHFEVASDIDSRTTRLIAREADQAFAHLIARFGRLPGTASRMKLYVFSGSTSYAAYMAGVEKDSPENTLGVFSPRLKQVLLWNQADRPATLRVVRHEVLHSYADAMLGLVPMWFSEGVAEYFALARTSDGRWQEGADAPQHLLALKELGLARLPLEELLYLDQSGYMSRSQYTYPMSWAFVDFLLNSTPANQRLFESLWRTLQGEIEPSTAVEKVFGDLDLDPIESEFWAAVERRLES